jgi:hypothetical protein
LSQIEIRVSIGEGISRLKPSKFFDGFNLKKYRPNEAMVLTIGAVGLLSLSQVEINVSVGVSIPV